MDCVAPNEDKACEAICDICMTIASCAFYGFADASECYSHHCDSEWEEGSTMSLDDSMMTGPDMHYNTQEEICYEECVKPIENQPCEMVCDTCFSHASCNFHGHQHVE